MAFNYNTKAYEETAELKLVDPVTGVEIEDEGKPVTITVYGASSSKHRKAVESLMIKNNKRGKREATLEEKRQESLDFLVSLSVTSDNLVDAEGNAVTTPEQFKALYSNESVSWIRDQVSTFVGDTSNFFQK